MHTPLIFVMYDSITNSVFESQVLQPLIQKKLQNQSLVIHIVSFESQAVTVPISTGITFHIFKKRSWLLRSSISQLRAFLQIFPNYELIARGPIAGYICLQTRNQHCTQLTIQARGLLAQEHAYLHQNKPAVFAWIYRLRTQQLDRLEKYVYSPHTNTIIESVSPALKTYLRQHFNVSAHLIVIAEHDIPSKKLKIEISEWRKKIRTKLNIPEKAIVYCYNGSAKPWQCPEQTISFFTEKFALNSSCLLLIVTQDIELFTRLLHACKLPENAYRICFVEHKNVYQYLAAANAGLLFREKHILNWISRPTKLLEYYAVNLAVVHNDTVSYAIEHQPVLALPLQNPKIVDAQHSIDS